LGDSAVALSQADRKKPFDLLLLNLMMPVMGGREALRLIRETPALQDLQVLILSGEHDEQEVRDVIGLGVLDFLLKPIGKEKTRNRLLAALETLKLQPRMRPTIPAVTERPTGAGQAV
jgi:CheY-like chemotaxis protein